MENGEVDRKVADKLKVSSPRTPQIYFLPKIHKNKLPPPGRPICSSNEGPTEKISAFLDFFLNPLVRKTDSFIKDTGEFVNLIKDISQVEPDSIIGSLDVSSLYNDP